MHKLAKWYGDPDCCVLSNCDCASFVQLFSSQYCRENLFEGKAKVNIRAFCLALFVADHRKVRLPLVFGVLMRAKERSPKWSGLVEDSYGNKPGEGSLHAAPIRNSSGVLERLLSSGRDSA